MPENSQNKPQPGKKRLTGLKALGIATEFGFIIVIPLLALGYLGKWLDNRFHQHFFVFIGLILAIVVSGLWFFRVIKDLMKDLDIK
jgi:hypothetical protein